MAKLRSEPSDPDPASGLIHAFPSAHVVHRDRPSKTMLLDKSASGQLLVRLDDSDDMFAFKKHSAWAAFDGSKILHIRADPILLEHGYALFPVLTICGRAISSMHIEQSSMRTPDINMVELFEALSSMPSLRDLVINVFKLPDLSPVTETPPISFHLRRLTLNSIFHGWLRLLAQSSDTLHYLSVGCDRLILDSNGPNADGSLTTLRSVTSLCLRDEFDPALVQACPGLHTLALVSYTSAFEYHMMLCLDAAPPTLQHLIFDVIESASGFEVWDIVGLLEARHPATDRLRRITILPYFWRPELDDEGLRARVVLQRLCRERRIAVSIFQ
ncbi:hypothetical protein EXIGLDRAFT_838337 [Exidia glandulosa HHB12029]|uniref:F-box domain-containing protein n=1 Tax=Exidia glandulosa HHB12029 TaxID=1314781 RepID=A0A165FXM7_EXIGL|nr:hypothetical protein EXIGLDRAFT_838337 [Exidia glandulosa HHB12029]